MIRLTPSLVLILSSVLGIAVSVALMMVGALWAWTRSSPLNEASRLIDDLARNQESLEALLTRLRTQQAAGVEPMTSPVPRSDSDVLSEGRPTHAQRADPAAPSAVGGPTLILVPSLAAADPDAPAAAAVDLGQRFGAIWALADAGDPPDAIARTTGQPIGQVELILGLRRQLAGQTVERT